MIFLGEKAIHHAHVQGFTEAAGTGDKSNVIILLPPLSDKIGFVKQGKRKDTHNECLSQSTNLPSLLPYLTQPPRPKPEP